VTPEQRRAAGIGARALLNDDNMAAALSAIERDIHSEWAGALFPRTREKLHAELRALQRVRNKLASMAGQAPRD
jgi:hypothetical protein